MSSSEALSSEVSSLLNGNKKKKRKRFDFDMSELEGKPILNPYNAADSLCFPFIYQPSANVAFVRDEARNIHSALHELALEECERNVPIPMIVNLVDAYYRNNIRTILEDAQEWSKKSIETWLLTLPSLKQRDRLEKLSNTIRLLDQQECTEDESGAIKPNMENIKLKILCMKTEAALLISYKSYNSAK